MLSKPQSKPWHSRSYTLACCPRVQAHDAAPREQRVHKGRHVSPQRVAQPEARGEEEDALPGPLQVGQGLNGLPAKGLSIRNSNEIHYRCNARSGSSSVSVGGVGTSE